MIHIQGILLINKEKEYTSHDIVNIIKKLTREKVGHTGTLDPNATGLLPILVGQATKLSAYLINHDKEYLVELKLGIKTSTADSEGNILETQIIDKEILKQNKIEEVLKLFIGKQKQIPPIYSAIKIKGKKLYEYARKNINVEIKPRDIEIYDIKLEKIKPSENEINFYVKCSKGTYIRSLCEDIALKLNTIGYMKNLKRISVGEFNINNSITIDELKQNIDNKDYIKKHLISIEDFFKNYKNFETIKLNEKDLEKFLNGVELQKNLKNGDYSIYDDKNEFIGIGNIQNYLLKRQIVVEKEKEI